MSCVSGNVMKGDDGAPLYERVRKLVSKDSMSTNVMLDGGDFIR